MSNNEVVTKDTIIDGNITLKSKWKLPYVCPENCIPSEDGSTCTREVTVSLSKTRHAQMDIQKKMIYVKKLKQ